MAEAVMLGRAFHGITAYWLTDEHFQRLRRGMAKAEWGRRPMFGRAPELVVALASGRRKHLEGDPEVAAALRVLYTHRRSAGGPHRADARRRLERMLEIYREHALPPVWGRAASILAGWLRKLRWTMLSTNPWLVRTAGRVALQSSLPFLRSLLHVYPKFSSDVMTCHGN